MGYTEQKNKLSAFKALCYCVDVAVNYLQGNVMLELRPCCECCAIDLPPVSKVAMICSFECTFCQDCASKMQGICPNCAGELVRRPIRPEAKLLNHPASSRRVVKPNGC